jgi:hypothetical protein
MKTNPNTNFTIDIDYSTYDEEVQKLKPRVYREGNIFCCLSGPDPETGIFGTGESPDSAIISWRKNLQERFDRIIGEEKNSFGKQV